ncbi:PREDICTED: CD302 antigen [Nanorana parkeri]|uniref:CD302 antigen n=1 Tax=Nanorana parkeri TaxID=125878 RepID=UPI000854B445|nr:PREDICTED: CD302 antigen [Nanorana parkeri]
MYINENTSRIVQERRREPHRVLLMFLCSVACNAASQSVIEEDGCPVPMWVQFNRSCYTLIYVAPQNVLGMNLAQELCKDIGADTVSIQTKEENAFLLRMFQTKWKGPKEVLLGMFYDADENTLKWFDKSPVTFTNWRQEKITDENLNTCVKMNTITGEWEFTECDQFAESGTLCKTGLGHRVLMISLVTVFALIVPSLLLLLFILYKKKHLLRGFSSRHLLGGAQVLPYSDDMLVDTMEGEDWA